MSIIWTIIATIASLSFLAIMPNIQFNTSYLARWSFLLWWATFTVLLWFAALYTGGIVPWPL